MSAIAIFLVVYLGLFAALIVGCAIYDEICQSRKWAIYWRKKRILELEALCEIPKRDSWYADE